MTKLKRFGTWFLARFRLSGWAICEMSRGMDIIDYHDYPDAAVTEPMHMFLYNCKRCGKKFFI